MARFKTGEALNRTVLPALTLMDSPVRGLSALRAFVLRTVKVPKPGSVNFPVFFIFSTMASINLLVARSAAVPVSSTACRIVSEIKAFDMPRRLPRFDVGNAISQSQYASPRACYINIILDCLQKRADVILTSSDLPPDVVS
jgi:hypothetical protein